MLARSRLTRKLNLCWFSHICQTIWRRDKWAFLNLFLVRLLLYLCFIVICFISIVELTNAYTRKWNKNGNEKKQITNKRNTSQSSRIVANKNIKLCHYILVVYAFYFYYVVFAFHLFAVANLRETSQYFFCFAKFFGSLNVLIS